MNERDAVMCMFAVCWVVLIGLTLINFFEL